jgi:tetratricopeptide (TPR) repeat protein
MSVDDIKLETYRIHKKLFVNRNVELLVKQAETYLELCDIKSALYYFKMAASISKEEEHKIIELLDILGITMLRSGRYDESETFFREAIRINPDWKIYFHYSMPAIEKNNLEDVEERIKSALKICNKEDTCPLLMILAHAKLKMRKVLNILFDTFMKYFIFVIYY